MKQLLSLSRHRNFDRWLEFVISLVVFALSFSAVAYRIDWAPDVFTDEIIYSRIGVRVAGEGALVWDSGDQFLVHPPLYYLIEGLFFTLTGNASMPIYSTGNIFSTVYLARVLNAFFAGLTGLMLYHMGRRLGNRGLGIGLFLLFFLDPFGVRINRRAMLETSAGLFSISGVGAFLVGIKHWHSSQSEKLSSSFYLAAAPGLLLAGLLLGAGLLVKEMSFTFLLSIGLYPFVESFYICVKSKAPFRKMLINFIPAAVTTVVASGAYILYPLWIRSTGGWSLYWREKVLGIKRMLGLVQLTGWNRPGVSVLDFLQQRMLDYGSSFILLALGGLALLGILIWGMDRVQGRVLFSLGIIQYPIYTYMAIAGSGNDQFYYFLLLTSIVLVGYAAFSLRSLPEMISQSKYIAFFGVKRDWITVGSIWFVRLFLPMIILFLLPFNLYRWWSLFGTGVDNGYAQFSEYVKTNVPPGSFINASGDPIKFKYFLPEYKITAFGTMDEARNTGVQYYALAPKDIQFNYGFIQPDLGAWIQLQGKPIFTFDGDSYGDIFLYRVDPIKKVSQTPDEKLGGTSHWRTFQPAMDGQVDLLILRLIFWFFAWGMLALGTWIYPFFTSSPLKDLHKLDVKLVSADDNHHHLSLAPKAQITKITDSS